MSDENKTKNEYLNDVKITKDALDLEWIYHAEKYMKWAERKAIADNEVSLAKENLEFEDAALDREIRTAPPTGIKITESAIKSEIITCKRHIEAKEMLDKAIYRANILGAVVKAMEQKKTALENSVKLWIGGYFAGPKEPHDIMRNNKKFKEQEEEMMDIRKRTSRKIQ